MENKIVSNILVEFVEKKQIYHLMEVEGCSLNSSKGLL